MSSRPLSDVQPDGFFTDDLCAADPGVAAAIAANRNPACRCAQVAEPLSASLARQHNDANAIALGARLIGIEMAKACVSAFLTSDFLGGRHQRRVDQLANPSEQEPA